MRSIVVACLAVACFATSAAAGTVVAATGKFKVGGKDAELDAGKPRTIKTGDVIDVLAGSVTWRSDAGDLVVVEAGGALREEEATNGVSYAFLLRGVATGALTDRTCLGAATGWACAPKGSKAKIRVEPTAAKESCETRYRVVEGAAWIRYGRFNVALTASHEVVLGVDSASLGNLVFRTSKKNTGDVEIHKALDAGEITAWAPPDASGCFNLEVFGRTKLACDVGAGAGRLRVRIRSGTRPETGATLAPGAAASISDSTGETTTYLAAVRIDVAEKALAATSEFTPLPASSFADGK